MREQQQLNPAAAGPQQPSRALRSARTLYEVAEVASTSSAAPTAVSSLAPAVGAAALLGLAAYGVYRSLETGSRPYTGNVGDEYDAWTDEGILEYYWGDHIHLGYYSDAERAAGYTKKDFKQAKLDFVDEMLRFSGVTAPGSVLDVGCGFGGSSRHLAKLFPNAQVQGITLSPKQVERGTQLAQERGLSNVQFKVMDALKMDYPDNSFDLVWACESGEHMPDKKKYVDEMVRVLKPGGTLVIACWCQREETAARPFSADDKKQLQFLYDEWAHPFFISIQEFERLMKGTGAMDVVTTDDWTAQTLPSWHHSIYVGAADPSYVVKAVFFKPKAWVRTFRDIVTLLRMHTAFESGLMQYGMMTGKKTAAGTLSMASAGASSSTKLA